MIDSGLLVQYLHSHPQAYQAFIALLLTVGAVQRYLGPKADWVEGLRRRWYVRGHELLTLLGAFGIAESVPRGHVGTIDCRSEANGDSAKRVPEDVAERQLYQMGFHRNVLAAKKYRERPEGRQWSASSWVHRPSLFASRQTHVTLFHADGDADGADEGVFAVYAHEEPSNVRHPIRHLASNAMEYGDAARTVRQLARNAGVTITNPTGGESDGKA